MNKSSVEEIRARFDADVERFAKREVGQTALIDAVLSLDIIAQTAASLVASEELTLDGQSVRANALLDVGCGAGNFTLALLERLSNCDVTLIDLSLPMLQRATERVTPVTGGRVTALQGDIRELSLPTEAFDVIVAASVLHHLRTDDEWDAVFRKLFTALRANGVFFVSDMIEHDDPAVQKVMRQRYSEYLVSVGGDVYRDRVFGYIEAEDTPRSLAFQMALMRKVGFRSVDVLHKNAVFAAFFGRKG